MFGALRSPYLIPQCIFSCTDSIHQCRMSPRQCVCELLVLYVGCWCCICAASVVYVQLVFLFSMNLHLVYMLSKQHVDRTSIIFLLFCFVLSATTKSTLFYVQCGVHVCVCVCVGGGGGDPHRLTKPFVHPFFPIQLWLCVCSTVVVGSLSSYQRL